MQKLTITNNADMCRIEIEGIIGVAEELQFDDPASRVATYDRFRTEVGRIRSINARHIRVDIRSTGGDVNDAMMIYDALRSIEGATVTTCCYGYTASAATIVAQAASEGCRLIADNALYLIHNSIVAAEGNALELGCSIDMLRKTDERLAAVYASRSGRPADRFAALMAENNGCGRWLSPEEALEYGLVDRIVGTSTLGRSFASNLSRKLGQLLGRRRQPPVTDFNVFRTDVLFETQPEPDEPDTAATAFAEGQAAARPTLVAAAEDPSLSDPVLSPNARAYADDLRRIVGK